MASPAEVANDLRRWAGMLHGTGQDALCRSLARGAAAIIELGEKVATLEAAAEADTQALDGFKHGEGEHGS